MPVLTLYLFESDTRELLVIGCDKTGGNLRRCKVGPRLAAYQLKSYSRRIPGASGSWMKIS
jgi:hypothetical protein